MFSTLAAFAMLWATAFPAGDPISYEAAVAADPVVMESSDATRGSSAEPIFLTDEQAALMAREPDWNAHASLYHAGGGGATGNDSLGCRPVAMRTLATDPRVIPRRTRLFIRETVGLRLPDGTVHDGYWYASDTGGAIRGQRVDLYTGHGRGSMQPVMRFNQRRLTITNAGRFDGCPPAWNSASN
ncbi:MAG: 3D domain-containing protein [Brevundimonas sp.]|uniref:3D domain-containing protein n=1 Tax=Brevundimonas sp. TaxID=1871086 RepID=UPI0027325892|nr:3D domain-containing protein [Brevundimonas sp.]MDP3405978.1 3D domain-containing protein [Brevundimonas sp.]